MSFPGLKVEITYPDIDRGHSLDQHLSRIADDVMFGKYTVANNVLINEASNMMTLCDVTTLTDLGPEFWDVLPCAPGGAAPTSSFVRWETMNRLLLPRLNSAGILRFKPMLGVNQAFMVDVSMYYRVAEWVKTSDGPPPKGYVRPYQYPAGFIRVYWGTRTKGVKGTHPDDCSEWALTLSPYSASRGAYICRFDPELDRWVENQYFDHFENTSAPGYSSDPNISSRRYRFIIQPKPPTGMHIGSTKDGGSTLSYTVSVLTLEEAEGLVADGLEPVFWHSGRVHIMIGGAGVACIVPVVYAQSGVFMSEVLNCPGVIEEPSQAPLIGINTHNPTVRDGGKPVGKRTPGTAPPGTSALAYLINADDDGPLSFPCTKFRYKIELQSSPDRARTPYIDFVTVQVPKEPELEIEPPAPIDATDYVTGCRISMSLDEYARSGTITLRNDDGKFNFLKRTDSCKIKIWLHDGDDYRSVFTGFCSQPQGVDEGPGTVADEHGYAVTSKLTVRLKDMWHWCDYRRLLPIRSLVCDWYFHNEAIWHIMRNIGGFLPDELDMPKNEAGDAPKVLESPPDGYMGHSVVMTGSYEGDSPSWAPDLGESVTSFITKIHETFGGDLWMMFFDFDGKFHYQPRKKRKVGGPAEYSALFYDTTSDLERVLEGEDPPDPITVCPILSNPPPRFPDVDYGSYRNVIAVWGLPRDPKELFGVSPPVVEGVPIEVIPIMKMWMEPRSWKDPEFEYFIGQPREEIIYNPSLCTEAEVERVLELVAKKFGGPKITLGFRSYWVPNLIPSNWVLISWRGGRRRILGGNYDDSPFVARVNSIELDLSSKVIDTRDPSKPRYTWFADYEVTLMRDDEDY